MKKKHIRKYRTEEDIELDSIPEVKGITPKGQSALNQWEQEMKEGMAGKEKGDVVTNVNYNTTVNMKVFSIDISKLALGLINISNDLFGVLGNITGNIIKGMLKK